MSSQKPSILIVEDEVFIANDVSNRLSQLGYLISGIAYSSDKALDMLSNRAYDLVILDINVGGSRDGIDLAEIINEKYHRPFIYLTSYCNEETLVRAQKTLPYGYLVKPFEERNLASTVKMALYRHKSENKKEFASLETVNQTYNTNLSEREYELILIMLKGRNIRETAKELFLSENTVKSHLKRIYLKLDVHNRVGFTKKILEVV